MTLALSGQIWWYTARSAGITAWVLCTLSVIWGLMLSTRAIGRKPTGPWLLDLHRFMGGLSVVFVFVHITAIYFDSFVQFTPAQLFIPLASKWHPVAVAWGIVGFYLLLAIEITSLLKNRIPDRFWHAVHMSSFVLYVVSTIHLLSAGTDRHHPGLFWAAMVSISVVLTLTVFRQTITKKEKAEREQKRQFALSRASR